MVIKKLIEGAGTLFDWGIGEHFALSQKDFDFFTDDAEALMADWLIVGKDLYQAMESQLSINTEGQLLFSPEDLLATKNGKEQQQTR